MPEGSAGGEPDVDEPTIGAKVAFLSDPASYRSGETSIEVKETHFSWVFLTRAHAYKLKKPTRNGSFDFRSVAARRRNAVAEVRLNRRLAPDIYLGVVPLTWRTGLGIEIDGGGKPVDWLVRMVRLDAERMLDHRLAAGDWHFYEVEALAHRLVIFFASASPVFQSPGRRRGVICREIRTALRAIESTRCRRLSRTASDIVRRLEGLILRKACWSQSVGRRPLIDGHGDLRPEHVYLSGEPKIIDCLEFRADLRRVDPLSEVAYLALECDRTRATPIEARLIRRLRKRTGDAPPARLLAFYKVYNALIRARLAAEHMAEPGTHSREEWLNRAASYLEIARSHFRHLRR